MIDSSLTDPLSSAGADFCVARNYINLLHATITAPAISLPHLSIKLLEIPRARPFLRRATTRPYRFNRDKQRLDAYVIDVLDGQINGVLEI